MSDKIPCSVYSRIVGYLTPTHNWNTGKRQEWDDRQMFDAAGVGNRSPQAHSVELSRDEILNRCNEIARARRGADQV